MRGCLFSHGRQDGIIRLWSASNRKAISAWQGRTSLAGCLEMDRCLKNDQSHELSRKTRAATDVLFVNNPECSNACFLHTNVLAARPDHKKTIGDHFLREVKRHADALSTGVHVEVVFMEAEDLEPQPTFRRQRREKGAFAIYVGSEAIIHRRSRDDASERSIAFASKALTHLGR